MNSNAKTGRRGCRAISTALLLSCLCVAAGALADGQPRSETVRFPDLNVATPEGAQALFNRIHAAANRVCSENDPILRLGATVCARKAEANAIAALNLPQLTAYYKSRNGDHTQPLIAAR